MKIKNHRDFWAGVMFFIIGVAFVVLSQQYTIGSAAKMGPGYFPTMLGVLMALLGLIVGLGGVTARAQPLRVDRIHFRPMLLILGAVAVFAFLLPRLGMVLALVALIGIAALASHEFRLRDTLIAMVVLIGIAWFVFVWGLELQFPVLPPFLTR